MSGRGSGSSRYDFDTHANYDLDGRGIGPILPQSPMPTSGFAAQSMMLNKVAMPTTVYIATAYRQKDKAAELRDELVREGFQVVSSWIDADEDPNEQVKHNDKRAQRDLNDIGIAKVLVNIAVPVGESFHGGRFVEVGVALATGKYVATIGRKENVFSHLPQIAYFTDNAQFVAFLKGAR